MIDIVLAVYNGEKYIAEQVRSIQLNDDYQRLINRFIIIDDGSADNTVKIIRELAKKDKKIELHCNDSEQHGVIANFSAGLKLTTAPFIMLSDQDDVWLPEKIRLSYEEISELAASRHPKPLLVFTDKEVVDKNLQQICASDYQINQLPKNWHESPELLIQRNVASGCTMIMNRELLNKALPVPKQAVMHDWWFALVAAHFGQISLIDLPLIKYRQHDNNTLGSAKRDLYYLVCNFQLSMRTLSQNFINSVAQAKHFSSTYSLPHCYSLFFDVGRRERMQWLWLDDLTQSSLLRKLALTWILLTN